MLERNTVRFSPNPTSFSQGHSVLLLFFFTGFTGCHLWHDENPHFITVWSCMVILFRHWIINHYRLFWVSNTGLTMTVTTRTVSSRTSPSGVSISCRHAFLPSPSLPYSDAYLNSSASWVKRSQDVFPVVWYSQWLPALVPNLPWSSCNHQSVWLAWFFCLGPAEAVANFRVRHFARTQRKATINHKLQDRTETPPLYRPSNKGICFVNQPSVDAGDGCGASLVFSADEFGSPAACWNNLSNKSTFRECASREADWVEVAPTEASGADVKRRGAGKVKRW